MKRGHSIVAYDNNPEVCIINTCTVTSASDRKSRQIIRRAKHASPGSIIVVTGCFPCFNKKFLNDNNVKYIIKNKDKYNIPDFIEGIITGEKSVGKNRSWNDYRNEIHSRALVKIQDGCEQNCSYCIVPKVRGGYKSKSSSKILKEVNNLEKDGFGEIVLTGIHIGKYGIDFVLNSKNNGSNISNLAEIVKAIIDKTNIGRIRLSSIEVNEISDEILSLMGDRGSRIAKHLHIPLQSGSNEILASMRRPYRREFFLEKIKAIRKAVSNVAITTDVIVGFPGETDEDFFQTISLVKEVSFSKLHVFKFSPRKHTSAANFSGQIQEIVKSKRSKILREIGDKLRRSYIRENIGKELEVLCEKIDAKKKVFNGTSGNYIKIYIPINKTDGVFKKGKMVKVLAESMHKDGLLGRLKLDSL
jgi:threonylcarbamoyladenosine tRNA methylthiotransferase MtaB